MASAVGSELRIPSERREAVLEVLSRLADNDLPAIAVARALALGIDMAVGANFDTYYSRRGVLKVVPGVPVPTSRPDLGGLTPGRNSSPDSLEDRIDRVRHLRIAPDVFKDVSASISFGHAPLLEWAAQLADLIVGAGHPNATDKELTYEVDVGRGEFFNVRPVSLKKQHERLQVLTDLAYAGSVDVLVLPELAVPEASAAELGAALQIGGYPKLLIAGSHHSKTDNSWENGGTVWIAGSRAPVTYIKTQRFKFEDEEHGLLDECIVQQSPQIHVLVAGSVRLAVLICRDFLKSNVQRALVELGVHLVLVPAMTIKADPFVGFAGSLVTSNQAVVVVSNNPHTPSLHHAVMAAPVSGKDPIRVGSPEGLKTVGRWGLASLVVRTADVSWTSTDN